MLLMMESALPAGLLPGGRCGALLSSSSGPFGVCRRSWHGACNNGLYSPRNGFGFPRASDGCIFSAGIDLLGSRLRAAPEHAGSMSDHPKSSEKPCYHPFEEMGDPVALDGNEGVRLTDAEISRTIIEVNSKATLIFSGLIDDEVHENIFWPELSYLTDEHGDIYFEVNNDEDILQSLTANDRLVQVLIGLDNIEKLVEMEVSGPSNIDFDMEEITSEDSDIDDDYEHHDLVGILDDEDDDLVSSEPFSDWTNLETMHSSHPMYFAQKMAEVVLDGDFNWMDQPSAGLVIQGLLRPAFIEERSTTHKQNQASVDEMRQLGKVAEDHIEEELEKGLQSGTVFYKLEMINIQLLSAFGNQSSVKVEDFRQAQPDVIAHSAAKIISRLNSGGEKTVQALKSLCWRSKGIQVEEVALTGVDSLGFDLRVCSGTQVQTLRFAFSTRATSEYSAERQLHDLLYPRVQNKKQKWQQAQKNGC